MHDFIYQKSDASEYIDDARLPLGKSVQSRWAGRAGAANLPCFPDKSDFLDFLSEVPFIKDSPKDCLIYGLELGKCKFLRKKRVSDIRISKLRCESLLRKRDNFPVIERHRRQMIDTLPRDLGIVGIRFRRERIAWDKREVRNRDAPSADVTIDLSECIQLLDMNPVDTRLLGKHPLRRLIKRFITTNDTARYRPLPIVGTAFDSDEEYMKRPTKHREYDSVHSHKHRL